MTARCANCRHWYGMGTSGGTGSFDAQCLKRTSGASGSFVITSSDDWCEHHEPAVMHPGDIGEPS